MKTRVCLKNFVTDCRYYSFRIFSVLIFILFREWSQSPLSQILANLFNSYVIFFVSHSQYSEVQYLCFHQGFVATFQSLFYLPMLIALSLWPVCFSLTDLVFVSEKTPRNNLGKLLRYFVQDYLNKLIIMRNFLPIPFEFIFSLSFSISKIHFLFIIIFPINKLQQRPTFDIL